MDSPVYGYLKHPSMTDYPGKYAAVFFTPGCNFRCGYCHNAELLGGEQSRLSWERLEDVCREMSGQWVDAAVVSGGEPTLQPGLARLLQLFQEFGWAVKLDTNGSMPEALEMCLPYVDYIAMDVKAEPSAYERVTGFGDTARIEASMRLVCESGKPYEFRTTVVPTLHDCAGIEALARWIAGARRYVLQPFVPREHLPDPALAGEARTSVDHLSACRSAAARHVASAVIRGVDA